MPSKNNSSERRTLADTAYQFGIGALLGLILVSIPLAISIPDMTDWNIAGSVTIVLLCGVLSALIGKRFLATLVRALDSFPPIA